MDGKVDREGGLGELVAVGIDHDQLRPLGEGLPVVADLTDIEPAAQHQHEVGILQGEIAAPVADGAGPADRQRMALPDQVMGVEGGGDRQARLLDEGEKVVRRAGDAHAGAGHDDWPLGAGEAGENLGRGVIERLARKTALALPIGRLAGGLEAALSRRARHPPPGHRWGR